MKASFVKVRRSFKNVDLKRAFKQEHMLDRTFTFVAFYKLNWQRSGLYYNF